ncbi:hypothetical protein H7D62_016355, partial [Brucella melitensis]|nr:hypothetical protein [Brucella melitensis]
GNHFGFFFLPAPKRNAKPFGFGFRKPIGPKSSKFSEWSKIIMLWALMAAITVASTAVIAAASV